MRLLKQNKGLFDYSDRRGFPHLPTYNRGGQVTPHGLVCRRGGTIKSCLSKGAQAIVGQPHKGSLLLEYSVLVAVVIAALFCMQFYLKRAVCGRWRQAADSFSYGRQYAPGRTQIIR